MEDGDFIAWCARTPALGSNPLEVGGGRPALYAWGASKEDAIAKLCREVLH